MARLLPLFLVLALAPSAQAANPVIHAHRGGSVMAGKSTFPENTLQAFRNAVALQLPLEMDTRITKDGKVVIMHDATLDRTTDCEGVVRSKKLAELAGCKVDMLGSPESEIAPPGKPAAKPQPIPTLAEVLKLARESGSLVDVEINNYPGQDDYDSTFGAGRTVADVILASKIKQSNVIIQSFLPGNIDAAKAKLPNAQTALITLKNLNVNGVAVADANGYDWVFPNWPLEDGLVRDAHAKGLRVAPYTLNKSADAVQAANLGVDALITDDPMTAMRAYDKVPPKAGVSARTKKIATVKRTGVVPISVTLSEAGDVAVSALLGGKPVGKTTAHLERGRTVFGSLRLSSAGRKALARLTTAKITLVAAGTDLARNRSKTVRVTASLK